MLSDNDFLIDIPIFDGNTFYCDECNGIQYFSLKNFYLLIMLISSNQNIFSLHNQCNYFILAFIANSLTKIHFKNQFN